MSKIPLQDDLYNHLNRHINENLTFHREKLKTELSEAERMNYERYVKMWEHGIEWLKSLKQP